VLPADGGSGGQAFESCCPPGKAVRSIRGRYGDLIDRIQFNCDTVGRTFSNAHIPRVGAAAGTATGKEHRLRCCGDFALNRLIGRAGSMIDRLSGVCSPTGAVLPITPLPPEHPMTPIGLNIFERQHGKRCEPSLPRHALATPIACAGAGGLRTAQCHEPAGGRSQQAQARRSGGRGADRLRSRRSAWPRQRTIQGCAKTPQSQMTPMKRTLPLLAKK
jgi:hypothetical protein